MRSPVQEMARRGRYRALFDGDTILGVGRKERCPSQAPKSWHRSRRPGLCMAPPGRQWPQRRCPWPRRQCWHWPPLQQNERKEKDSGALMRGPPHCAWGTLPGPTHNEELFAVRILRHGGTGKLWTESKGSFTALTSTSGLAVSALKTRPIDAHRGRHGDKQRKQWVWSLAPNRSVPNCLSHNGYGP